MLHNAKATVLTIAILCAAGCAKSDRRVGHQYGKKWTPVDDRRVASAPDAVPPKILPATYFAAAQLFEQQGSLDRAIMQYQRTIGVQHDHVDARHLLGRLLGRIGRHREAIVMLQSAVGLAPDRASLHNDLGFELVYVKQWDEAEYAFRKAIKLRPAFPRAYINLGMTLCRLDRHDEALESFQAVLTEADAYYNLGLMYRGQARYTDALQAFRTAFKLDPELVAARDHVAMLIEQISQSPIRDEIAPTTDDANIIESQTEATVVLLGPLPATARAEEVPETIPRPDSTATVASPKSDRTRGTTDETDAADTVRPVDVAEVASSQDSRIIDAHDAEVDFDDDDPCEDEEHFVAITEVETSPQFDAADTSLVDGPSSDVTATAHTTTVGTSANTPVEGQIADGPIDSDERHARLRDDWPSANDDPCVEEFLDADFDAIAMVEGPPQVEEEFFADEPETEVEVRRKTPTVQKDSAVAVTETPSQTPTRTKREFFLTPRQPTTQKRSFTVATVKRPTNPTAPQTRSSADPVVEQDVADGSLLACTVEPVPQPAEMCPAEAICYVDTVTSWPIELLTGVESVFAESYVAPVSFVGQGQNPAMMIERRIHLRQLTDRLADIRDEINCLTDREDERQATARAIVLGIDLSPVPLRRTAVAAVTTEVPASVARAQKPIGDSNVTADRPRETMAATVIPPSDTTKTEVVGPFAREATLSQLADQLNHVRQEISCLEDVAIEEQIHRNPRRFSATNDSKSGSVPIDQDRKRSDATTVQPIQPQPCEFVPINTVEHPVMAWLGAVHASAAMGFPMPMPREDSIDVRAKEANEGPTEPTSTARLTLKVLDGVIRDSSKEEAMVADKPDVEKVAASVPATELRWLSGLFDALETEASCRSGSSSRNSDAQTAPHRKVIGKLPPEIPFETFLDIMKMQPSKKDGNDSAVKSPTGNE